MKGSRVAADAPPRAGGRRPHLHMLIPCAMPDDNGETCGRPGEDMLPAGICAVHALAVYRALRGLVDDRAAPVA